jgi:outer membrane receptor protein involved in Fe transport
MFLVRHGTLLLLLGAAAITSVAQTTKDTTRTSHPLPPDSVRAVPDSLRLYRLPPESGSVDGNLPDRSILSSTILRWSSERALGEVLQSVPGFGMFDQNSEGSYSQLNVRGVDWRSIGFMLNGRPLNDPASGIYNPYHAQLEDYQKVEVVTGPRAFLYGLNTSGAAVNFVTRDFNTNKPYSKLIYAEGPYGFAHSDGTFSQNITRRMNIAAGFQHLGTDGRYPSGTHDQWEIRGRLRYHLSERFALIVSENYLSTRTDLNGGVNLDATGTTLAFQPLQAVLVNPDSYEKLTRHDLDVSLVAALSEDSSAITRFSLFHSDLLREYREGEAGLSPGRPFVHSDQHSSWLGARYSQSLNLPGVSFSLGGSVEELRIKSSPNLGNRSDFHPSAWARAESRALHPLQVSIFGRIEKLYGNFGKGLGVDGRLALRPGLSLFGGVSVAQRLPNMLELFWSDSTVLRTSAPSPERHIKAEAGVEWQPWGESFFRLTLFQTNIEDPISFLPYGIGRFTFPGFSVVQGGRLTTRGLEAGLSAQVWYILLEGSSTLILQKNGDGNEQSRFPRVRASGGVYLRSKFFSDHLDLKAGFRGEVVSSFSGDFFNAEALTYVQNPGTGVSSFSRGDFLLTARIGEAYIHLVWENLLDSPLFATPYYPARDRGLRFGVAWEFQN